MTGKLLANWLQQRKIKNSHRQVVLISGELDWCLEQVDIVIAHAGSRGLILSNSHTDFKHLRDKQRICLSSASQYKQQLGKEFDFVVYNAFDGVKPSALYAVEGTVGKSGLLVILSPSVNHWSSYSDKPMGIAFNLFNKPTKSLFIERMCKLLIDDPFVAHVSKPTLKLPFNYANSPEQRAMHSNLHESAAVNLSADQQAGLNTLLNNSENHCVGLIKAKRGRGKSTLLGRLGAELQRKHKKYTINITASHRNNCKRSQIEFERACFLFSQQAAIHNSAEISNKKHIYKLNFIAADQLSSLPQQSILLIDEAATLSPTLLLAACKHIHHVVMATTTAGYEGSGLGFSLRVLPKLKAMNKSLVSVNLQQPIRWFENDSLESTFEHIFAPFEPAKSKQNLFNNKKHLGNSEPEPIHFNFISKNDLSQDEHLLAAVFTLLVQSHYQTSPDDLMRIMDAPDHYIAILSTSNTPNSATNERNILAVAVIVHEGVDKANIEKSLLNDITSAKRRINGHLVAQNLTSSLSDDWFFTAKSWRIMRIAVQAEVRHKGLGSLLLEHIKKLAIEHNIEYVSTSFGLNKGLIHFWQQQGYRLIKIGARIDTSSGEHSGIMITNLSHASTVTFSKYSALLLNDALYLQAYVLAPNQHTKTETHINILRDHLGSFLSDSDTKVNLPDLEAMKTTHQKRIFQFINGNRSFSNVAASIYFFAGSSKHLQTIFAEVHQAHLSKETKLSLLISLKNELKQHIGIE